MGALALLITAILATLVLYFWARKAQLEKQLLQEREENDRIMSIAEDLQGRLNALQGRQKGSDIGLDMLDRLFEQYYVYEGTDNLQPKVLKEVRTLVEGLRGNSKLRQSLEKSLNDSHDGVMKRFEAAGLPIKILDEPMRWSEDFGWLLKAAPGVYFGIGAGETSPGLHTEEYEFDDALIQSGVRAFSALMQIPV